MRRRRMGSSCVSFSNFFLPLTYWFLTYLVYSLQDDAPGSVDRVLRSDVPEHIKERILRERGRKHNTGVKVCVTLRVSVVLISS